MDETTADRCDGFDSAAAITRSLLGWGVVAGAFYLVTGLTLGLLQSGFDFGRHALSLLMLGDHGWVQSANLILSGLMTLAAAVGVRRAIRDSQRATAAGVLIGIYGACLVVSAIFRPDPVAGFPEGAASNEATTSGLLHLASGGIGFLALASAALVMAGWFVRRGESGGALFSRASGVVVAVGFLAGGALATRTSGVVLLWVAVVAGWTWLAVTSVKLYRAVPRPDAGRDQNAEAEG